jgi:hypothetical protein
MPHQSRVLMLEESVSFRAATQGSFHASLHRVVVLAVVLD